MFELNKNSILVGVALLAIVITGVLVYANSSSNSALAFLKFSNTSSDAIAKKSLAYLNGNVLQAGQTATLESFSEESGMIKMNIKITSSNGTNNYTSYATKDGKLFFPEGLALDSKKGDSPSQNTQGTQQTADVSKVDTTGKPYIGSVNAPAVMAFWYDYQCPFCKKMEQEVMSQLTKDYVDTGKLKIVFKNYAFLGADSQTLAKYSRAVWEVVPSKFYQWHKAMFDNQGTENTGWATQEKIMSITTNAIGASNANKVLALVKSKGDTYQKENDTDKAEGTGFGITGTPASIIGKRLIPGADTYASFKSAVDAALSGK